ncbi:unnamed protein product, partial [Rotaria sp. Silwood2]
SFVATIELLRRRDPVLDQWFKHSSLRPCHEKIAQYFMAFSQ